MKPQWRTVADGERVFSPDEVRVVADTRDDVRKKAESYHVRLAALLTH